MRIPHGSTLFRASFFALLFLAAIAVPLKAATVELPLSLDVRILQNALEEALPPDRDGKTTLYRKDTHNFFTISDPRISFPDGEPRFRCAVAAGAGFDSLGLLPSSLSWNGSVEMLLAFYMDSQWRLRYRIIDAELYDSHGARSVLSNFAWPLSRKYLHPRLEAFALDLSLPQREILDLLRDSVPPEELAVLEAALNTIAMGSPRVDGSGLVVPLLLTMDEMAPAPPETVDAAAEQPLSLEEIEGLPRLFEPLDAFLVFVVKSAGADFNDPLARSRLFDLLITNRYKLVAILAGETEVDAADPLRTLFVEVWRELRVIIESGAAGQGTAQEQLLRYMTFINAGDALLALDAAAPRLGMEITTNGLRRLARMLQPAYKDDPLHYDWEVDPELRKLLNFSPAPTTESQPQGTLLLDLLIETARAAEASPPINAAVEERLRNWAPSKEELTEYQGIVAGIIEAATLEQLAEAGLEKEYAEIYRSLLPATALIESCWQQFTLQGGQVVCQRSASGSLGMMQINPRVWRGFYSIERLRSDLGYNLRAGAQILMRYFKEQGLKVAKKNGNPGYAARAAYAAYNAGPQAASRFLKPGSARASKVDERLWTFYQGFAASGHADLHTCAVATNKP